MDMLITLWIASAAAVCGLGIGQRGDSRRARAIVEEEQKLGSRAREVHNRIRIAKVRAEYGPSTPARTTPTPMQTSNRRSGLALVRR